jgi:ElaB/YqjD/DUF883 family membrane-anchored ribosome-binding protein
MDASTTREQVSDVVEAARSKTADQAGEAVDRGRSMLRRQVDARSTTAGEQAQGLAQTLRDTAQQLRTDGDAQKARYAQLAEQGADRLERAGSYLSTADADELLSRAESLARRQPWLVAGAGLLVGIAAGRIMKASSSERYQASVPAAPPPQSIRTAPTESIPTVDYEAPAPMPTTPAY